MYTSRPPRAQRTLEASSGHVSPNAAGLSPETRCCTALYGVSVKHRLLRFPAV